MATKTTKKTARTKPAAKTSKKASTKKLSQLDAAVKVLKAARKPLNCKAMVEAMATKKLWTSPGGKTPDATLYAAILRAPTALRFQQSTCYRSRVELPSETHP